MGPAPRVPDGVWRVPRASSPRPPAVPGTRGTAGASRDTGAAALEFALVAPLLFALLFMVLGAGWGLWEYQAVRATTREAARLAAVGIPDLTAYRKAVVCLGTRNGLQPGSLTQLELLFHPDTTPFGLATNSTAIIDGYVEVRLTYRSSIRSLPLADWSFTDANGQFVSATVTRIEEVGTGDVTSDQKISVTGEVCS